MERAIAEFKPDVVHAHKLYPQLSAAPVAVARRAQIPVVQTVHDYEFIAANPLDHTGSTCDHLESRYSYRLLNSLMFRVRRRLHIPAVTSWIAVSRAVALRCRARGIDAEVLPNFVVDGASIEEAARRGILFVGRLTAEKGVADVLAVARARPEIPIKVAGWGPLAQDVTNAAKELPNLAFYGRVSRDVLPSIYARALVTIVPSLWEEPGALSVLESMAAGTPLVVYRKGGAAEYVRDARAGLVVDPTPVALVNGVRELFEDSGLWEACSANARNSTETTHSPATYVRRLTAIYEDAMEQ